MLLVSSLDKAIYRPTGWFVDVNDNFVTGLGHSIQQVGLYLILYIVE